MISFSEIADKKSYRADKLGETKARVDIGRPEDPTKFRREARIRWDCEHHKGEEQFFLKLSREKYAPTRLYDDALVDQDDVKLSSEGQQDVFKVLDDGTFKWDLWLYNKPASRVLKWDMEFDDGVSFHFQPSFIDQWEIDPSGKASGITFKKYSEGMEWVRPEYERSYTVLSNRAGHIRSADGKTKVNYRTGKLGVICRPHVTDKNGWRVWAEVKIDEKTKVLSIVIPKDFYDKAIFPVYVDPTIGHTSIGSSSDYINKCRSLRLSGETTAGSTAGNANKVWYYGRVFAFGPAVVDAGFYDDTTNDGTPDSLVNSVDINIISSTAAWHSATISGTISANGRYYTAAAPKDDNPKLTMYRDFVVGSTWETTGTTLPSTFGTWTSSNVKPSMYLEYTETTGTTYTLTASPGAFSISGTDVDLTVSSTLDAASGSFNITGSDVEFSITSILTASSGAFSIAGSSINLVLSSKIVADVGAFLLSGQDASLDRGFVIPVDTGSFVITGFDASFSTSFRLLADSGAFTLLGQSVALTINSRLDADNGSFLITGYDVDLLRTTKLSADSGVFNITGNNVEFVVNSKITAEVGNFVLTGFSAGLDLSGVLNAESGTFNISGSDVVFSIRKTINAESGSFLITGFPVTFEKSGKISAESGAFILTGFDANLQFSSGGNVILVAESGEFLIHDAKMQYVMSSSPDPCAELEGQIFIGLDNKRYEVLARRVREIS
jgi:hypothetical protein